MPQAHGTARAPKRLRGNTGPATTLLAPGTATVAGTASTSSTTYVALTGPSVTLTTNTRILVIVSARVFSPGAGQQGWASVSVDGGTASDVWAMTCGTTNSGGAPAAFQGSMSTFMTVTAGSHTFAMRYRSTLSSSAVIFENRTIQIIPLN